ncbi:type II secretion system secretin GspD [Octadecabacter ascidiaceicola]|uniref:Type II secretion system protein D n=1 Tax=Octadecabacter ascidiaceicola TaxID=1655543 RepID=A0A238K6V0_9RHOB|nr:type II secretion system secretin GspD [Octadecabacter ascidiaceicola]SMX38164.1 Type II secretion system protein D precursor [Octadecabacter ascidiaceicola]
MDASISAAAEAIIAEVLDKRFVIQDGLEGRITIQSTGPIPKSALVDLFQAALNANGARLEVDGDIFSIVAGTNGRRTFQTVGSDGVTDATIIVAPLEHISAGQMVEILSPLTDDGLNAVADSDRNLILLSGSAGQLESAMDALNLFDVDVMRGKSIAIVRLEAADPSAVVEELEAIFGARNGGLLDGVIEFHPNDRLNSVLVISSRSQYMDEAKRWIHELDRTAGQSQQYTRVYPLQNRQAAELAPVLNQILGGGGTITATSSDGDNPAASMSEQPRVAADPERNALIVRALQPEHAEIGRLLHDLDNRAAQVALEATIAEVTLNDEVSLGVRFFLDERNSNTTFSDAASGGVSPNFPGFSSLFTFGDSSVVLNALAGATDVKIISSPTLMVLDNKEAELQIGDQVPVATQTAVSTKDAGAPVVTTIDYRDTGVILRVRPQIGAGNTLTLEISQEVSSVANTNTSGIDSPTIRQRQITTSVVLRDGATLALGGLVQERDNLTDSRVPGLGDIPFLGSAFRNRDSSKDRTELLILIRPRIIRTDEQADQFTSDWRVRLSGADSTLQSGLGEPTHSLSEILR